MKHKKIFGFKYPKLFLLLLMIILSYIIFQNDKFVSFLSINQVSYPWIFIFGILISFGFTAPLAITYFIFLNPANIFLTAFIASIGSVIADYLIFHAVRISLIDEFEKFEHTKPFKEFHKLFNTHHPTKIKTYIFYVFIGIVIASPIPDEIGITMLAGLSKIKQSILLPLSLLLHFAGIYLILLL